MNTNKFLLGGLVATIAIVSVQITNQLQIQGLIEKIDSVAIPQQAAVVTAVETKTSIPTLSENTCLKSTITQSFGTNMKQSVEQKLTVTATCDKTVLNEIMLGFSAISKESLMNLQLKETVTGKIYPIVLKSTKEEVANNGQKFFVATYKLATNLNLTKNSARTFSLVRTPSDVQMYIPAVTISTSDTKNLIPYSNYTLNTNSGPISIPIEVLNELCDTYGGPWTIISGTTVFTCTDAVF